MPYRTIFTGAIPPKRGDEDGRGRWEWAVFFKLWAFAVFALWSIGAFTSFGFPGFARAADVKELQEDVRKIQVSLLEAQLITTRREQCKAIKEENAQARGYYARSMMDLRNAYYNLTGHVWEIPPCDSI